LRGSTNGTQRVSSGLALIPSIARIAVAAAIVLTVNDAAATLGPPSSRPASSGPSAPGIAATEFIPASTATVSTYYSESWSRIVYRGTWSLASSSGYLGGRVKWTRQKGASATFSFTGVGFAWIGPVGPTRGQARIYVGGQYVKTVSMYASAYVARHTIFSASYSTQRTRTVTIAVVGTAGHPTVAIDALVVRSQVAVAPPLSGGKIVNVSSIGALKQALADNTVDQIVVADGTYHVSPSNQEASDSLWIGNAYAGRTRPVLVRAATIGGVTFDGGGGGAYGGLSFEAGAHDQTWDGFNFANMSAVSTGIIEIGGYLSRAAPHHLTLRHIAILSTCTGRATAATGSTWDHAIYVSQALAPGPHDLLFEDIVVHGEGNLASAFHFYHGADKGGLNAHDVVIRRLTVTGTQQAFLIWEPSVFNVTLDTATITNAKAYAIRYETIGSTTPTGIRINNVTSTGSGYQGFFSTLGSEPPGITFSNDSLH